MQLSNIGSCQIIKLLTDKAIKMAIITNIIISSIPLGDGQCADPQIVRFDERSHLRLNESHAFRWRVHVT